PALAQAVANADLVQENGPERIDFKQELYGELDQMLPPDVIIASSSSGLTMSEIQKGARSHPERCVIAHPFNPPHLIPLVEIVGGPGGIEHFFQPCTGPMTAWWKTLGSPVLTPEVQKKLIDSVHAEVGSRTIAELEAERDEILLGLIELRTKRSKTAARHEVAAE